MNNTQRARLDTCNRVKDFNSKNAATLATVAEYAAEQTAFITAYGIISNAAQVQSGTTATTTEAVLTAKETMAKTLIKYALRSMVKARQLGNITLVNHLDHPVSYITHAPKTIAVQRAKDIKGHINDNLTILTNINPANITEMADAIAAYDAIKDNPTIDVQHRAATGTGQLPDAFTTAFKAIDNMFDLVTSYFTDTNKAMVDEFALAKQIINTGIHHTGVTGTVTKDGHPVKGVSVSIDGSNKAVLTDMDGHYTIARIRTGDYKIAATDQASGTQSKTIHITKGNFEMVDFTL